MSLVKLLEGLPSVKVKLADIAEDPQNPNKMDKDEHLKLNKSMKYGGNVVDIILSDHPSTKPIRVDKKYLLVDGHQRLSQLKLEGVQFVYSKITHWTLVQCRKMMFAIRLKGTLDKQKSSEIFKSLYDLGPNEIEQLAEIAPVTLDEIKLNLDRFYQVGLSISASDQDINIPPIPKKTKIKAGDMFQLGEHKIMCGDCTSDDDVSALFDGLKADQVNGDPPYGVDYVAKNKFLNEVEKGNRIQIEYANDKLDDYRKFYGDFLKAAPLNEYNTIYIWSGGMRLHELRLALEDAKMTWGDYLVWVKNNHVLGRKDYQPKSEFCLYGWKGKHKWYGGFQTNVFFEDKPLVNEIHPTQKPLALIAKTIVHGTKPGMLVYDPFAGSGTTLIASHQNNRICYTIEKIPHFVDAVIQRWEKETGLKAVKL